MKTTTAETTLNVLRTIFARFGLPSQIVSDNGPQFIAEEFKSFCRANGIQHNTSAPYDPSTNGLAERFVQIFKMSMKSSKKDNQSYTEAKQLLVIVQKHAAKYYTRKPGQIAIGTYVTDSFGLDQT